MSMGQCLGDAWNLLRVSRAWEIIALPWILFIFSPLYCSRFGVSKECENGVHTHVCTHGGQKQCLLVFSITLSSLRLGVSLSLDPTHWLDWLATKPSEPSCLCRTSLGLQSLSSTLAFFMWIPEHLNRGLSICKHCHCLSPGLYLLFQPNPVKTLAKHLFLWPWQ